MISSAAFSFFLTALGQGTVMGLTVWIAIRVLRIHTPSVRANLWSAAFFGAAVLPFIIFLPGAAPEYNPLTISLAETSPTSVDTEAGSSSAVGARSAIPLEGAIAPIIVFVWLIGTGWCAIRFLRDALVIEKLRRESVATTVQSLGLPASITARVHPAVQSPFATGLFRPTIILPANMLDAEDSGALRATLAHEFAHVQRGDLIANFAESLVLCIFWWNAPMQIMRAFISEYREMACDDYAVTKTRGAGDYASALVACAEWAASTRTPPSTAALAIVNDASRLKRRVTRIAAENYAPAARTARPRTLLATATLAMATACTAAAAPRVEVAPVSARLASDKQPAAQSNAENLGRALVEAVIDKDMPRAKALLAEGADINAVLLNDGTPLIAAVNENAFNFAEWLIANGADVNAYALYDETALISAVRNSNQDMVRLLIDAGADVNQSAETQNGVVRSPLGEAKKLKRREIAAILISAGATQ